MSKRLRAILVGCGNRGRMFGSLSRKHPEAVEIVALAEPREEWRRREGEANKLSEEQMFGDFSEALGPDGPEAELVMIASNDRSHYEATMMALRKGCHVLLEKPVAHDPVLTANLALEARRRGLTVAVQHELRYAPFFQELYRLLRTGRLGQIYSYQHTEHVEFWHMTHSFVRGNWCNSEDETPMILAKCCHDLDLMPWLLDDVVTKVSSFGRLDHYRQDNAPQGAPKRCTDGCPDQSQCIHDAETFYLGPVTTWPVAMIGDDMTPEGRRRRLAESRYSRCVFGGHNDVVDHQVVMLETSRGTICTLTMQGFAAQEESGRKLRFDGTKGTLRGDMQRRQITIHDHWRGPMGTKATPEVIELDSKAGGGHGGGDDILFADVIRCLTTGRGRPLTTIEDSVESHMLAWAAEQSRATGQAVDMTDFRACVYQQAEEMMRGAGV